MIITIKVTTIKILKFFLGKNYEKLHKNIYIPSIEILRIYKISKIVNSIDKYAPKNGVLADNGFYKTKLTANQIIFFGKKFSSKISIDDSWKGPIEDLFDQIIPISKEYLGNNIVISNFCFTERKPIDADNISSNWHTDNVGHCIKIFCCLCGDGTQPTALLPGSHNFSLGLNKNLFRQIARWRGEKNISKYTNQVIADHKTGTIYIFDVNMLHRGCYEHAKGTRRILQIDILNRSKYIKINNGFNSKLTSLKDLCTKQFIKDFKYSEVL
jgi:hypothetical protein